MNGSSVASQCGWINGGVLCVYLIQLALCSLLLARVKEYRDVLDVTVKTGYQRVSKYTRRIEDETKNVYESLIAILVALIVFIGICFILSASELFRKKCDVGRTSMIVGVPYLLFGLPLLIISIILFTTIRDEAIVNEVGSTVKEEMKNYSIVILSTVVIQLLIGLFVLFKYGDRFPLSDNNILFLLLLAN